MTAENHSFQINQGTGPLVDPLPFSDAEYERRMASVRARMRAENLDAFITFTPENIYYLTGHDTSGYYFLQATVVTHDMMPVNVIRRIESSNTELKSWARLATPYEDTADPIAALCFVLNELGVAGKRIGGEGEAWFVSPARYNQLRHNIERTGGELVDVVNVVENIRVIKSEEELVYIRQGARIVEQAMDAAFKKTFTGSNENEVAAVVYEILCRHGSQWAGLPCYLACGPRSGLCHSTWSGKIHETGDVAPYEINANIKRYACSLFRMAVVGQQPTGKLELHLNTVSEATENLITNLRGGMVADQAHKAVRDVFHKNGIPDKLGHRVAYGLGVSYPPDTGEGHFSQIREGDQHILEPGMVFHLVPGIVEFGKWSIGNTETVLITDGSCEVITDFPRDIYISG